MACYSVHNYCLEVLWTNYETSIKAGIRFLVDGGGGGGGGHLDLFVKLAFEIAFVQYTRTHDETFGPQPPTGARGAATTIFGPFLAQL